MHSLYLLRLDDLYGTLSTIRRGTWSWRRAILLQRSVMLLRKLKIVMHLKIWKTIKQKNLRFYFGVLLDQNYCSLLCLPPVACLVLCRPAERCQSENRIGQIWLLPWRCRCALMTQKFVLLINLQLYVMKCTTVSPKAYFLYLFSLFQRLQNKENIMHIYVLNKITLFVYKNFLQFVYRIQQNKIIFYQCNHR